MKQKLIESGAKISLFGSVFDFLELSAKEMNLTNSAFFFDTFNFHRRRRFNSFLTGLGDKQIKPNLRVKRNVSVKRVISKTVFF